MHAARLKQIAAAHIAAAMALVAPMGAGAGGPTLDAREGQIFGTVCARCHVRPGIGAPVLGDEAEWADRRTKGFDVLLANTITGYRDMPPLGTCGYCDEDELRSLVAFMTGLAPPSSDASPSGEGPKP